MHLRLEAPMASFGGEAIDNRGVIRNFPAQSMVTGLFANALGWTRWMRSEHQRLQDRILFGAVHDANPDTLRATDYQTAKLRKADRGWSTWGGPLGRAGGANTYVGAHQRWREYHSDLRMSLVVRLMPMVEDPTADTLAAAMQRPARPLFIGRKPCLPTVMMFRGWVDGPDIVTVLRDVAPSGVLCEALWLGAEGADDSDLTTPITDERNWISGLHGGARLVCRGRLEGTGTQR
ncbi:MAG: type I-E CRISPR-associated protein Cas5/CasD [Gemmatimonadota bacterium]|nr:type I-E CRISPR-associated protein Cas5/CasD [Gemmatimonadota bacterium]